MGLERNLGGGRDRRPGHAAAALMLAAGPERVTHIVFMGMGEPLANYTATW